MESYALQRISRFIGFPIAGIGGVCAITSALYALTAFSSVRGRGRHLGSRFPRVPILGYQSLIKQYQ
jgi:hypothetical protein